MYYIVGRYNGGELETIDEYNGSMINAFKLCDEYRMAFGQGWHIYCMKEAAYKRKFPNG